MKNSRAFTLIELMVVVSIITMLASIVLASIGPVRARARDAKRVEEIHQIDLAVQEYVADNGYPPDFDSCAAIVAGVGISSSNVSSCIAVSTPSVDGNANWADFVNKIKPYMPNVPTDPCGSSCDLANGTTLGYTYYSPEAAQYYGNSGNSYYVYAPLEGGSVSSGNSGGDPYQLRTPVISDVHLIRSSVDNSWSGSVGISWNHSFSFHLEDGGNPPPSRRVTFRANMIA